MNKKTKIFHSLSLAFLVILLVCSYSIPFSPKVSARSQRAIVADMCNTAIDAAIADGNTQFVIMISGADENGNPVPGGTGNPLCNGSYSDLSPEEVTDLVNDSLCDEAMAYTGETLCDEYASWVAGGGDTKEDKDQDKKDQDKRKNSIQGAMDTVCNQLKTENPGLYNQAAFCVERANPSLKKSSLQNFCIQYGLGMSDTIKNACKEAINKGYIASEEGGSSFNVNDIDCKEGGMMGWILCPVFELGANVTSDAFENVIKPMLENVPVTTNTKDPFYKAWSNFRLLGNIVLVGAMLVLVYAQARGGGR